MLLLLACSGPADTGAPSMTVATFNTGLGSAEGQVLETSDTWYGNGLAWLPALEAAQTWASQIQPDLVVFQEIFDPAECVDIPEEARAGFVCEHWAEGDPHVALQVLGEGYSLSCHPGNTDKCLAIRDGFGSFDEAWGGSVEGCGSGARVARVHVEGPSGPMTLVNVHGSSGLDSDSSACRVKQVEQVFLDLGDGEPAIDGARNLVMGDLNTDPGRFAGSDDSAVRWNDFVGADHALHWHTEVGPDAPGSYAGLADIDHVASDAFVGPCEVGPKPDEAFDHRPVHCTLELP